MDFEELICGQVAPIVVRHDVLSWTLTRKRILFFADPSGMQAKDLSPGELKCAVQTLLPNRASAWFWLMAEYVYKLASWGHKLMGFLHGCPCHPSSESRKQLQKQRKQAGKDPTCPMAARMLIPLSLGCIRHFEEELQQVGLVKSDEVHAAEQALDEYPDGSSVCDSIYQEFCTAKNQMMFRLRLTFSCWTQLPWSIFAIMEPWARSESGEIRQCETLMQVARPFPANKKCHSLHTPALSFSGFAAFTGARG